MATFWRNPLLPLITCLSLSAPVPSPSEPEPQLGTLILSNITPDSFNVSWTTQAGPFAKIVINVSDSHSLHEPQQFTVSGDAQHAHVTGLLENTGYDVSVAGTTWAGDPTRALTAFVVTGTHSKVLACLFGFLKWGKGGEGLGILKGKFNPKHGLRSTCKFLREERANTTAEGDLSQPLLGNGDRRLDRCLKLPRNSVPGFRGCWIHSLEMLAEEWVLS